MDSMPGPELFGLLDEERNARDEANEGIRISWCHLTPEVDWESVARRITTLR